MTFREIDQQNATVRGQLDGMRSQLVRCGGCLVQGT
jgi:hypothetical protein